MIRALTTQSPCEIAKVKKLFDPQQFMFIIRSQDGKIYKEGTEFIEAGAKKHFTWDNLPIDIKIAQMQLTLPFSVTLKAKDGKVGKTFAPLLTIGRYDRYYFFNEATVKMLQEGDRPARIGQSELVAKVIGGIDNKLGLVVEMRVDRNGNCTIHRFPLKALEARIKAKTFRGEIIRKGI